MPHSVEEGEQHNQPRSLRNTDLFYHLLSGQLGFPHRLHNDLVGLLAGEEMATLPDQGRVEVVDEALKVVLGLFNLEQGFD